MTDEVRRKESLYAPLLQTTGSQRHASAFGRAFSPLDALNACAPSQEPEESVLEQLAWREALADALDSLEEDDRWIFDMLIVGRLSLRFVGLVIGMPKTTVARRRDRIIADLQRRLLAHPVVKERLDGYHGTPLDTDT